jgi:hypothetical protein
MILDSENDDVSPFSTQSTSLRNGVLYYHLASTIVPVRGPLLLAGTVAVALLPLEVGFEFFHPGDHRLYDLAELQTLLEPDYVDHHHRFYECALIRVGSVYAVYD